jgi:acyl transferase domain-containing protein
VNNFGYGGANAHVILESMTPRSSELVNGYRHNGTSGSMNYSPLNSFVISISAKEESIARSMVTNLGDYLRTVQVEDEMQNLKDLVYTLGCHRSFFQWTTAQPIRSRKDLIDATERGQFQASRALEHTRLGFVFTGQGAQWFAMGRELIDTYPVFRNSLNRANQYLKQFGCEWSIIGMSDGCIMDDHSTDSSQRSFLEMQKLQGLTI